VVEGARAVFAEAMDVRVPARIRRGGVRVAGYVVPDERDPLTRQRDAAIVWCSPTRAFAPASCARCAGATCARRRSPSSARRARTAPSRALRTHERRAVRLLAPLAADLAELRASAGRPADAVLMLPPSGEPASDAHPEAVTWTKTDWQVWRDRRWAKACKLAGMASAPRPYDLRHSFASLLLAEGKSVHYVARQLGHSPALTLNTYGHLFAEYEDAERIDAELEIARARSAPAAISLTAA
jgi:hypothetical protein